MHACTSTIHYKRHIDLKSDLYVLMYKCMHKCMYTCMCYRNMVYLQTFVDCIYIGVYVAATPHIDKFMFQFFIP